MALISCHYWVDSIHRAVSSNQQAGSPVKRNLLELPPELRRLIYALCIPRKRYICVIDRRYGGSRVVLGAPGIRGANKRALKPGEHDVFDVGNDLDPIMICQGGKTRIIQGLWGP
ncbi:hypothetical protein AJ79_07087 [Helicocarpus griseus UAMH5409]|uniref:Uncharacterized protein n=1 Tax=Helicocarpus griseus UAMH5409 TaxID=1447875 RepID=A0A2B7X6D8_9EURO|nr:hypothetical protein AJ79_07087 [Helicocarpus griseus UAMH5409]